MKDDAMERVLAELGKVEAPSGLQGQVLRRLAERGTARASRRGWVLGAGLATTMVLFGALALSVGLLERRGGERTPGAEARTAGGARYPKAEALGYPQAKTTANSSASLRNDNQRERNVRPGRAATSVRPTGGDGAVHTGALLSFPAPAEPLTEQERLLVRVARHPRAGEVEFLIAEVREAALVKTEAEFDLFFPPPKVLEETEVSQPVEEKENNNEVQPKVR